MVVMVVVVMTAVVKEVVMAVVVMVVLVAVMMVVMMVVVTTVVVMAVVLMVEMVVVVFVAATVVACRRWFPPTGATNKQHMVGKTGECMVLALATTPTHPLPGTPSPPLLLHPSLTPTPKHCLLLPMPPNTASEIKTVLSFPAFSLSNDF